MRTCQLWPTLHHCVFIVILRLTLCLAKKVNSMYISIQIRIQLSYHQDLSCKFYEIWYIIYTKSNVKLARFEFMCFPPPRVHKLLIYIYTMIYQWLPGLFYSEFCFLSLQLYISLMLQLYDILLSNKLLMSATPLNLHCFSDRIMRKLLLCCPTHTQINNYVQLPSISSLWILYILLS